MSKHTKGKWEDNDGDIVVKVQDNWPIIAIVQYVKTMAETRANAQLIAAAPDLLAACKAIQAEMGQPDYPTHTGMALLAMEKVRNAIKKAEGK